MGNELIKHKEIHDLINIVMEAEPIKNDHIDKFHELIEKDFSEFCEKEPDQNDAIPLNKLRHIESEMRRIAVDDSISGKRLGAIGGGFSSGKSAFLNSFISGKKGVHLPEGINPVTVIPTFLMLSDSSKIKGVSAINDGSFDIPIESQLSHESLEDENGNLKKIISKIISYTVSFTPMQEGYFENLCLIDTPGYNPAGSAKKDFDTALEYIQDADFLIWMIGLDANGTIPGSDLSFIRKLENFGKSGGKPLYIVANKADHKDEETIKGILDNFEKTLETYGLCCDGMCAYSSSKKKVYAHRKMDIYQFLSKNNKESDLYERLIGNLDGVFEFYKKAITENAEKNEKFLKIIKDIQKDRFGKPEALIDEQLEEIENHFKGDESLNDRLARVKKIHRDFEDCFNAFCKQIGIKIKRTVKNVEFQTVKQGDSPKDFESVKEDDASAQERIRHSGGDAELVDANAQFNLGIRYYTGEGADQNYYEAVNRFKKAAEQGHCDAQYKLGLCYARGRGVSQNYYEAFKWYQKSAEQGH